MTQKSSEQDSKKASIEMKWEVVSFTEGRVPIDKAECLDDFSHDGI